MQDAQKIQMLEQQTSIQKIYVEEAKLRDAQTRSFRHDIQNHLHILSGLLQENKIEQAHQYLVNLGHMAQALRYPVHTNNVAVDVLLSSKFAVAEQQGVRVECMLSIPTQTIVSDMDWCILLSNAMDNAICASAALEGHRRFLTISDRQKGNFYLIQIQNACVLADGEIPKDGIGLSNMRAVVQKYGGTLGLEVAQGIFHWEALLLISQQ